LVNKLKSLTNVNIQDVLKRIESEFLAPFYDRVIAPLEEKFLRPLEIDLKKQIKEWGLSGVGQLKDFLRDTIVAPLEDKIFKEFEGHVHTIVETIFKFTSQDNRDNYKVIILQIFDTKIRQPLMEKINKILAKVEAESYEVDAEVVFLQDALKFIKDKIITPLDEKLVQPFKNLIGKLVDKLKSLKNVSFTDVLKRIQSEFLAPLYDRVIAPLEEKFLKPLQTDLKEKLQEWGIKTREQLKEFLRESVVEPLEEKVFKEFEGHVHTIVETIFKFTSQETRDSYKVVIIDMFNQSIRQPLMDKINKILMSVETEESF